MKFSPAGHTRCHIFLYKTNAACHPVAGALLPGLAFLFKTPRGGTRPASRGSFFFCVYKTYFSGGEYTPADFRSHFFCKGCQLGNCIFFRIHFFCKGCQLGKTGCWLAAGWLLAGCWRLAGCWLASGWLLAGCWLLLALYFTCLPQKRKK